MKINIKNLTCQNKKIRLVPKQEDSVFNLLESELPVDYLNEDDMVSFCLGVAEGCSNMPPFNPDDIFGTPDSSCSFPLKELVEDGNTLEESLEGLQNTSVSLYLKNTNESDTTIKIFKMEGPSRFEDAKTFINNPTVFVTPGLFQVCLRGNTCVPGVIDFSGVLILPDEIQGTIGSQKFFSNDQFIDQLSNLNLEVTELFEWEEPVEVPEIDCENATNEVVLKEYSNSYAKYTVVINGIRLEDVGGMSLTGVLETVRSSLYNDGFTELYNAINFFSDSSYKVFILNLSSSITIQVSLTPTSIPPNTTLITKWLLPADFNENKSIVYDPDTGELSFCLSPRKPLGYVSFSGWFGEGWMNIHKYAIEVNGVLYEDPRTYSSEDSSFFVGSLQDVIDYNAEALYMLGTYSSSSGDVELYLTSPGTYNIRLIKQPSTFDWYSLYPDGNFLFVKEPEFSKGEFPVKDINGNWSFTLYLQEEQEEDNGVILS